MNSIILNQLKNVTAAEIRFDTNTTNIFIPKTVKISNASIKVGNVYDIELNDSIVHPGPESVLASNWNGGVVPKYNKYTVEILSSMAKMVKVNGVAIEDNLSQFSGWLPNDGFTITKKY